MKRVEKSEEARRRRFYERAVELRQLEIDLDESRGRRVSRRLEAGDPARLAAETVIAPVARRFGR